MSKNEYGAWVQSPALADQLTHAASTSPTAACIVMGILAFQALNKSDTSDPENISRPVVDGAHLLPITGTSDEMIKHPGPNMSLEVFRHGLDRAADKRRSDT